MANTILELRGISQYFPGIKALDKVDFTLEEGQIHALIGENGAGKSTLIKILTGIYRPTSGDFLLDGKPVHFHGPTDSQAAGIAAIHQEAVMFPDLSVSENIWMAHQARHPLTKLLDHRAMRKKTRALLDQLGMKVEPRTLVRDLSVAERHMVEIAKALSMDARIVIMDEPTSALSLREVEELFEIIHQLKASGKTIIFVSHKFEEIFSVCDSYTVLRDGRFIGRGKITDTDTAGLVKMMVGRSIDQLFPKEHTEKGEKILEVRGLGKAGIFKDISFDLHKGEILGFFGLVGSGRSDIMNAIVGIAPPDEGHIRVKGRATRLRSIQDAIRHRIGYVPEDRQNQGAVIKMAIRENITLPQIGTMGRWGWIDRKREQAMTADFGKRFEVRAASYEQKVLSLSGGNQQKVVLAKWLATDPEILILDEPTKGIDIATKWAVYQYIFKMAKQGMAIILVSSELPEVLGLTDRVLVMHEGRLSGEFSRAEADSEKIMHAAIGSAATEAKAGAPSHGGSHK
jgi:rhamnose transport system ATP-binding protein